MRAFRSAISVFAGLGALLLVPVAHAGDYQVYKNASCSPNSECGIDFANVPSGKKLRITNYSCFLAFPYNLKLGTSQLVVVNNSNGSPAFVATADMHLQDQPVTEVGEVKIFVSNDTVRAVAKPGQHLRAYAKVYNNSGSVGTVTQLSCGISGTMN